MIENSIIVILGGSGDLAKRKLMPALAYLFHCNYLDKESCLVLGNGRTEYTNESFRKHLELDKKYAYLEEHFYYHSGFDGLYGATERLGDFANVIVFFSLPPANYTDLAQMLVEQGFPSNTRIVIEKPFGYNLESAKKLNSSLRSNFEESNIYRIDHYLAKEGIQNILAFRFASSFTQSLWNKDWIESIEINAFEKIGVEKRGAYFDSSGIIRDMVQNHLLQLLSFILMEEPSSMKADDIREAKLNILKQIKLRNFFRYQYEGYLQEDKIKPDSKTETFAELEFEVEAERWKGVPCYIRTGKMLHRKGVEVVIRLKKPSGHFFDNQDKENLIVISIQPEQKIIVTQETKKPGFGFDIEPTYLSFNVKDFFGKPEGDGYDRLLYEALAGDRKLFVDAEETEQAWAIIEKSLDREELKIYPRGSLPESQMSHRWVEVEPYL